MVNLNARAHFLVVNLDGAHACGRLNQADFAVPTSGSSERKLRPPKVPLVDSPIVPVGNRRKKRAQKTAAVNRLTAAALLNQPVNKSLPRRLLTSASARYAALLLLNRRIVNTRLSLHRRRYGLGNDRSRR